MSERDELDQLIDLALANYAEPRAGLEQRMLARISLQVVQSPRRRWVLVAAIAVPAIAVLLLLSYLIPWSLRRQPGQMAYTPKVSSVAPHVTVLAPHAVRVPTPPRRIRPRVQASDRVLSNAIPRPKLDVFPAPQPLSTGEQALVSFVAQASEDDRKALIEDQKRVDEPLNISAIRIPPLQLPEGNQH
ncbi:MAG TPA: hypothetical protein VGI45_12990 [Terracidiphilus sp.]|jgi:hypothetical protein